MLAMRDADEEPPIDALVRPCEWPSEDFMHRAGIKEEFNKAALELLLVVHGSAHVLRAWVLASLKNHLGTFS